MAWAFSECSCLKSETGEKPRPSFLGGRLNTVVGPLFQVIDTNSPGLGVSCNISYFRPAEIMLNNISPQNSISRALLVRIFVKVGDPDSWIEWQERSSTFRK